MPKEKTVTITVIHDCKKCSDEGAYVIYDQIVKCDKCDKIGSQENATSWFEINKKYNTLSVKAGVHLSMYPNTKTWVRV